MIYLDCVCDCVHIVRLIFRLRERKMKKTMCGQLNDETGRTCGVHYVFGKQGGCGMLRREVWYKLTSDTPVNFNVTIRCNIPRTVFALAAVRTGNLAQQGKNFFGDTAYMAKRMASFSDDNDGCEIIIDAL